MTYELTLCRCLFSNGGDDMGIQDTPNCFDLLDACAHYAESSLSNCGKRAALDQSSSSATDVMAIGTQTVKADLDRLKNSVTR